MTFLNFQKVALCHANRNSFLSYKSLKLKLRVFLAGHIIAVVTYCATRLIAKYLAMIGQILIA